MRLHLTIRQRQALNQIIREVRDVRILRRALAILDLDDGASAERVARRYQVTRSTVYNWIKRCRTRGFSAEALDDRPRSGRPRQSRRDDQDTDGPHR